MKRFSNSSYLTPEAAAYLNEAMQEKQTKIEEEIVYAGLHEHSKGKMKFKRNLKFTSRYRKRGMKRRRKGKFG